jgi:hypothetical protein
MRRTPSVLRNINVNGMRRTPSMKYNVHMTDTIIIRHSEGTICSALISVQI